MSRRFLCLFLAVCCWGSCRRPSQEVEPNDDAAHANPLSPNGSIEGTISSPDDVDWYKITIPRDSGILNLHVTGIKTADFVLSFRDKDLQELKRIDETGVGGDEEALDLGVTRGEYYVVLSNKNPKADNPTQKYLLSVSHAMSHNTEAVLKEREVIIAQVGSHALIRELARTPVNAAL